MTEPSSIQGGESVTPKGVAGRWILTSAFYGTADLSRLLTDGWEPFAITPADPTIAPKDTWVWLRKWSADV